MDRKYDKTMTKVTYFIAAAVVIAIVYFIFVKPYIVFRSYEKQMHKAGEEYFQINRDKMPTGKRVGTVKLSTLSSQQYLDKDFTVPLSSKLCNYQDSWVKVRYEESDYKYYIYLDCGYMESKVDHEGPVIKLNGDSEMTVTKKESFIDPGVNSVIDKIEGKMNIKDVEVSGEVNTDNPGTYKITYKALDSLKNETTVTRTVKVIDTIFSITKRTNAKGFYPGDSNNNYIYFSNQLYRIVGLDGDNVKIVSNDVVGIANYAAIDKQLKKYYKGLSSKSKKLIVKTKYCKDTLSKKNLDTTECSSYTEEKELSVPSVSDLNKIRTRGESYLESGISYWTADSYNDNYSYLSGIDGSYAKRIINTHNGGIKPIITVKGNSMVSKGLGTRDNPYIIDKDVKPGSAGELINRRLPGEYININNNLWRIVEPQDDGTTKIVMDGSLSQIYDNLLYNDIGNDTYEYEYNPKKRNTYAYYINNKATTYLSTDMFTSHEIKVPIYKEQLLYGKETDTKTYKVKISAPNIYDLYTASMTGDYYLVINTVRDINKMYLISATGDVEMTNYDAEEKFAVKPVVFLKSGTSIVQGNGRETDPYEVK